MLHRVVLPQLGQTMEEGVIEKWRKQEGEAVRKGEVLFELTTDKATLEVEAFADGIVKKLLVPEGATVPVNQIVAVLGDEEDELPADLADLAAAVSKPEAAAMGQGPEVQAGAAAAPARPTRAAAAPAPGRVFSSPRARKVARENKVPVEALAGSGPRGRVIERDVERYIAELREVRYTPAALALAFETGVRLPDVARAAPGRRVSVEDVRGAAQAARAVPLPSEVVPLSPMRRTIAERMAASKRSAPHFYLTGDVMMRRAMDNLAARRAAGTKLTVTVLLIKAAGLALREHPRVNARFQGDSVALNAACNVGVAVGVEDGLFVPVVRDADRKDLAELAQELRSLAAAARAGRLSPEQYEGGSITLSNLGMFGVDFFLPIINPPESCILGVGAVRDRVIAVDGEARVEPVMTVSVSGDHRVIDGVQAAQFFRTFRELIEEPERLA